MVITPPPPPGTPPQPKAPGALCAQCPLFNCRFVPPHGPLHADLIVIGEAPGAVEVGRGVPFMGPSGDLLAAALKHGGVPSIFTTYRTNTVCCRPPNNADPTQKAIDCCKPRLEMELSQCSGRVVLALGNIAKRALSHADAHRGQWVQYHDKTVLVTYHPAYVLRSPDEARPFILDVVKAAKMSKSIHIDGPPIPFLDVHSFGWRRINTYEQMCLELQAVPNGAHVAFDIEANGLTWHDTPTQRGRSILMIALAWGTSLDQTAIIPQDMILDDPRTIPYLNDFLARVSVTAHNGKFDSVFVRKLGLNVRIDFDTMLAHYTLDEAPGTHGLKVIAAEEFSIGDYERDMVKKYLSKATDEYSKVPEDQLGRYATIDVVLTWELRRILTQRMAEDGLIEWPFRNLLMPAQQMLGNVEYRGAMIDRPWLLDANDSMLAKMAAIYKELIDIVTPLTFKHPTLGTHFARNFNPNSVQQVASVLYDLLKLPAPPDKRLNPRSTAHEAIHHLKDKVPFVDALVRYRRVSKLRSTYTSRLLEDADVRDRVHTTFLVFGTETGRIAAKSPALQTIPRPSDEYGRLIRGAFVAPPGRVLVICDYSQAELRVLAAMSGDPFLLQCYREGRDLHTEVALRMYGPNYTDEQRTRCKNFNFAWVYGGNEYSFAQDQGLDLAVAKAFVYEYNQIMPVAVKWKADQHALMLKQGYIASTFGRRRRVWLVTDSNKDDIRKASINSPVQATASDLTLLAACKLDKQGVEIVLLVHDSIISECDISDAPEVASLMAGTMVATGDKYLPQVPWKADTKIQRRWYQPKDAESS